MPPIKDVPGVHVYQSLSELCLTIYVILIPCCEKLNIAKKGYSASWIHVLGKLHEDLIATSTVLYYNDLTYLYDNYPISTEVCTILHHVQ